MRFCSLGSGSRGNAHLVEKDDTTLLVECGFPPLTLKKRLASRYVSPAEITAALISHEHSDHTAGIKLLNQYSVPIYMSAGTARELDYPPGWRCLSPGEPLTINNLTITPLPVPHDVAEPLQFVVDDGIHQFAIFTDLGHVPPIVRRACATADVLAVECNYDEKMLREGSYPEVVKQRIAGNLGHLSNAAAAALVAVTKTDGKARHIIAAHLSDQNNTPDLARQALAAADGNATIHIADQKAGTEWIQV